jgi:branched-chain amino acid transport system ATP-binding protein
MTDTLLQLAGVHTHIGRYHILHGVDLAVRRGRLTMLLGRNGAGKTTTLRTIMGLWRASAGTIQLTVRENMLLATGPQGFDDARLDEVFAFFPALRQKWQSAAWSLSGGQKQMLAIGRAIIEPRRLLVVDEPTKGLAPAIIETLIEAFIRLKATATTILLVEQNFHMARSVGDDVAVMDDGHIVHTGSMADLAADEALQQRLLGLSLASHQ